MLSMMIRVLGYVVSCVVKCAPGNRFSGTKDWFRTSEVFLSLGRDFAFSGQCCGLSQLWTSITKHLWDSEPLLGAHRLWVVELSILYTLPLLFCPVLRHGNSMPPDEYGTRYGIRECPCRRALDWTTTKIPTDRQANAKQFTCHPDFRN